MTDQSRHNVPVGAKTKAEQVEQYPIRMFNQMVEVERLFDQFMLHNWLRPIGWGRSLWQGLEGMSPALRAPSLDVINRDKDFLVRAQLPGVEKKDLDVSVNESSLTIKGCVSSQADEPEYEYLRCENESGKFSRTLSLPIGVDSTNISATLKDGVLEIVLPKDEGVQRRSVEVK